MYIITTIEAHFIYRENYIIKSHSFTLIKKKNNYLEG